MDADLPAKDIIKSRRSHKHFVWCRFLFLEGEIYVEAALLNDHQWLKTGQQLTHCGLVMPYGVTELGQHWLRWWLVAWQHQAITWTNVDLSSVRSLGIHLRALSLDDVKKPINNCCAELDHCVNGVQYSNVDGNYVGDQEGITYCYCSLEIFISKHCKPWNVVFSMKIKCVCWKCTKPVIDLVNFNFSQ